MSKRETVWGNPPTWRSGIPALLFAGVAGLLSAYGIWTVPKKTAEVYGNALETSLERYLDADTQDFDQQEELAGTINIAFSRLTGRTSDNEELLWRWAQFSREHANNLRQFSAEGDRSEDEQKQLDAMIQKFSARAADNMAYLAASDSQYQAEAFLTVTYATAGNILAAGGIPPMAMARAIAELDWSSDGDQAVRAQSLRCFVLLENSIAQRNRNRSSRDTGSLGGDFGNSVLPGGSSSGGSLSGGSSSGGSSSGGSSSGGSSSGGSSSGGSSLKGSAAAAGDETIDRRLLRTDMQALTAEDQLARVSLAVIDCFVEESGQLAMMSPELEQIDERSIKCTSDGPWENCVVLTMKYIREGDWNSLSYLLSRLEEPNASIARQVAARWICHLAESQLAIQSAEWLDKLPDGLQIAAQIAVQNPQFASLIWRAGLQSSKSDRPPVVDKSLADSIVSGRSSVLQHAVLAIGSCADEELDRAKSHLKLVKRAGQSLDVVVSVLLGRLRQQPAADEVEVMRALADLLVEIEPESGVLWYSRGLVAYEQKELQASVESLAKANDLLKDNQTVAELLTRYENELLATTD